MAGTPSPFWSVTDCRKTDLRDFAGVTCITGYLWVQAWQPADLPGLDGLVAVGGHVKLIENDGLVDLAGLHNLRSEGALSIVQNPALTSLAGLSALQNLGSAPAITANALLPSCWAERLAQQLGQSCSCSGNTGRDACP